MVEADGEVRSIGPSEDGGVLVLLYFDLAKKRGFPVSKVHLGKVTLVQDGAA